MVADILAHAKPEAMGMDVIQHLLMRCYVDGFGG